MSCSETCGGGVRTRFRYCANPSPLLVLGCEGDFSETIACNAGYCDRKFYAHMHKMSEMCNFSVSPYEKSNGVGFELHGVDWLTFETEYVELHDDLVHVE